MGSLATLMLVGLLIGAIWFGVTHPRGVSLGCGALAFLGASILISLFLLIAVPAFGFIVDTIYWLMLGFFALLYLVLRATGRERS